MSKVQFGAIIVILGLLLSTSARAQRPGPGGPYTTRRLVVSRYVIITSFGPLAPALFGQRLPLESGDSGIFVTRRQALDPASEPTLGFVGGVMIGGFPNFEFGAVFANIEVVGARNFVVLPPPIIMTYQFPFDSVDIGLRLNLSAGSPFRLFPGVPIRIRLPKTRIDTGVFPSVQFLSSRDDGPGTISGLNLPVRVTYNIRPHLFAGFETGFVEPAFTEAHDHVIPLGVVGGYTFLNGSKVIDFNMSFVWDNFLFLDPAPGEDAVQAGFFRFNVGLNLQFALL
ncbi:MAG: hypothetical protein ACFB9M_19245 [Myxococcota bacterium]